MSNLQSLPDIIMSAPAMQGQVQEIIDTATGQESMNGPLLWASLVYSGVSMGVQEAERHFTETSYNLVRLLRQSTSTLDVMIAQQSDLEIIASMAKVRKEFQDHLDFRATALRAQKLGESQRLYSIEPDMITGGKLPEDYPLKTMENIGYVVARKAVLHFHGWATSVIENKQKGMTCHCSACMVGLVQLPLDEQGQTLKVAEYFGGFSSMYRWFAVNVLNQFRKEYVDQMDGTNKIHGADTIDAAALARDMMANLRKSSAE